MRLPVSSAAGFPCFSMYLMKRYHPEEATIFRPAERARDLLKAEQNALRKK
jgi:hypothetical protein